MEPLKESELLDPVAVARAEALGMQARFVVEGYLAGEHRSPYHGFAVEFAQHREYSPGDDVRHLDWKVLGRTERYYIKQYEQETNYVSTILLDGSQSMSYQSGRWSKLEFGKMMAACLAYLVLWQRDAVRLAIFDKSMQEIQARSNNRLNLHRLLARLAAFEPSNGTDLGANLHDLARQLRRKGIVIVISDFLDDEQKILDGLQHLRYGGHEVILFQTLDPAELEFPFQGQVEFEGLEGEGKILADPQSIRGAYLGEFEAFQNRLKEGCERNQCHYLMVNTAQQLSEVLSGYLVFRARTS